MTLEQFASYFHMTDFIMANAVALICTLLLRRRNRLKACEEVFSKTDEGQRYEYVVYSRSETLHLYSEFHSHELTLAALCYADIGAYKVEVRDRRCRKES